MARLNVIKNDFYLLNKYNVTGELIFAERLQEFTSIYKPILTY